jgi:ribosomal protein S18 acetylase RimI-like enzyme
MKVRPYRAEDRAAVRTICFETGLMGDSVAPQFSDKEAFADLFTGYYTDHEPESCFVVEAPDGRVVGYLVGTLDTRRAHRVERVMARVAFTRQLGFRPGTARFFWRGVRDAVAMSLRGQHAAKPDLALYPAHTHFSLLPEARRGPAAAGLYRAFFQHAKRNHCPGVYGEVFVENERAADFHDALGFERLGEPTFSPALRGPKGERLHVQLWVRKL